jgi:hypothetical protein
MTRALERIVDLALVENAIRLLSAKSAVESGSPIVSPLLIRVLEGERARLHTLKQPPSARRRAFSGSARPGRML